jgi:hypothetical protein
MEQKTRRYFNIENPFLAAGLIVLVTLFFYWRVLGFGYVWDDPYIFYDTIGTIVEGPVNLTDFGRPFLQDLPYFRPFVILSFYLDVYIADYNPAFSHAVNLVIFILNALLIFSVCKRVAEKTGRASPLYPATFAALLYVAHPAMIESVAWISGRFDALVTFFVLSATWVYLGSGWKRLRIALVSLLALMALLCKENGAMFPAAILCLWGAVYFPSMKARWKNVCWRALRENFGFLSGFVLIFAIYLFLIWQSGIGEGYDYYFNRNMSKRQNFYEIAYLMLETLKFYMAQAFSPFYISSPVHPVGSVIRPDTVSDILGNMATLAFMGAIGFFALRKNSCAAWIFIAGLLYLLPVLNIIPIKIGTNIGHARFLSAPLAFFVMAISLARYDLMLASLRLNRFSLAMRVLSIRRIFGALAGIWILSMAFTTYFAIPFWKNDLLLWSWARSAYSDDESTRNQYFLAAISADRHSLVEKEIWMAMQEKLNDSGYYDVELLQLYGLVLLAQGNPQALESMESLIDLIPEFHIHEFPDASERLVQLRQHGDNSFRTIAVAANTYLNYALAVLYFGKDPEKALEMNTIGQWYMDKSLQRISTGDYQQIAFLYALGKFEEGNSLLMKIKQPRIKSEAQIYIGNILAYYCRDFVSEPCKNILERGIISTGGRQEQQNQENHQD